MGLVIFQNAFCRIMRLFVNMERAGGSSGYAVSMTTPRRAARLSQPEPIPYPHPQMPGQLGSQDPEMRPLDAVSACVSSGGVERTRGLERSDLRYEGTCAVYNSWLLCVVWLHTMRMKDGYYQDKQL